MIVVIGGIKGGCGKTTLSMNLTSLRASKGNKVLLIDADDQKSASDWSQHRDSKNIKTDWTTIQLSGKSMFTQIERLEKDYDDIIIDVGGRDTTAQRSSLLAANVYLVPFRPRALDVWTIGILSEMIEEALVRNPNLKSYAVINQGDIRGSDNDDSLEIISDCKNIICLDTHIKNRKAFSNATAQGLSVIELKKDDKLAVEEIIALHDKIFV